MRKLPEFSFLILLDKLDNKASYTFANNLINVIPDIYTDDLFFLREYAIRVLARSGNDDLLIEERYR